MLKWAGIFLLVMIAAAILFIVMTAILSLVT